MRQLIIILTLILVTSNIHGQTTELPYSQKICFTNLNGRIYFDSLDNSVTTQVFLASPLKIKFKSAASPKQVEVLLSNSENSSTGTWLVPADTFLYRLTTKFIFSKDTFKVNSRKVEHADSDLNIPTNGNVNINFLLQDTAEFIGERIISDTTLLKFIPNNHLLAKVIYKDIDFDNHDEIILVSNSVYFGYVDRMTESGGPEECWLQILKQINGTYESVFTYHPEPILQYISFVKLLNNNIMALCIGTEHSWRDSHPKLEIIFKGKGTLEDCMQVLTY
ncbi:MAG: hypothetical protein ACT4ON_14920 [Bacteroidota bacterium]